MAIDADSLKRLLSERFPDAEIELTDLVGDNDHWRAVITSEQFRGQPRVAQHQLVYAALGEAMGGDLHALAITTRVPPDRKADRGGVPRDP